MCSLFSLRRDLSLGKNRATSCAPNTHLAARDCFRMYYEGKGVDEVDFSEAGKVRVILAKSETVLVRERVPDL